MPKVVTRYDQEFIGRVRAAREQRFGTQTDVAVALGMTQGKYKQYEVRSLLPHAAVPQFCKVCGVTIQWLVGAEGPGPKWEPFIHKPAKRQKTPAKRRKVG